MIKHYVGVDQGGTKTLAVICSHQGKIISMGRAPGGYHYRDGLDKQLQTIKSAVHSALEQLPGAKLPFAGIYAGLTGVDWPGDQQLLMDGVKSLGLARQVDVIGDMFVAFRGGTSNKSGVILIAGTGANCAIISPEGEKFSYNFYVEPMLQGGRALGRAALLAIYCAATGRGPMTQLTKAILDFYSLPDLDTLLKLDLENRLPCKVDQLATLIFTACDAGDDVACQVVSNFASGLASLVTAGIKRYSMDNIPLEVIVSGSVFKTKCHHFYRTLKQDIHKVAPFAQLVQATYEPVVGAAMLALEADGITILGDVKRNIETSSLHMGLVRQEV